MELSAMLAAAEQAEVLRSDWEESPQSLPEGEIEFLTKSFIGLACERFVTSPDGGDAAVSV